MSARAIITAVLSVLLAAGAMGGTAHAQWMTFPERMAPGATFIVFSGDSSPGLEYLVLQPVSVQDGGLLEFDYGFCGWGCDSAVVYSVGDASPAGLWRLEYPDGEIILEFEVGAWFQRGDANVDGKVDISDPIFTLAWLFVSGEVVWSKNSSGLPVVEFEEATEAFATLRWSVRVQRILVLEMMGFLAAHFT